MLRVPRRCARHRARTRDVDADRRRCRQSASSATTTRRPSPASSPRAGRTRTTTTACSSCHANTDGTSAATAHANVANHATGTHGHRLHRPRRRLPRHGRHADLTDVHTTGCALTRACHSPTVYNPTAKTCTNAGCHPTANYNTTTYAHNAVNGTDATHTVIGGQHDHERLGRHRCHDRDLLRPATPTSSRRRTTTTPATRPRRSPGRTSAPAATTPRARSTSRRMVTAGTFNDSCLSGGCHNTTQQAHVDGGTDTPAVTGTEADGAGSCISGACHATADLHALHKGDGVLPEAACSVSGCHDATNLDKRPTKKSCGVAGDVGCHNTDAHDPAAHTTLASSCMRGLPRVRRPQGRPRQHLRDLPRQRDLPDAAGRQARVRELPHAGHSPAPRTTRRTPDHYTGTETTHTASSQTGTETYTCVTCHNTSD